MPEGPQGQKRAGGVIGAAVEVSHADCARPTGAPAKDARSIIEILLDPQARGLLGDDEVEQVVRRDQRSAKPG